MKINNCIMKGIYITILSLFFGVSVASAQEITDHDTCNDVNRIVTSSLKFGFKENIEYRLEYYYTNTSKELFLCLMTSANSYHNFTETPTILIKKANNEVITLKAVHSTFGPDKSGKWRAVAWIPMTKEIIESCKEGVQKVRMEILSIDKFGAIFAEVQDKEYDKDKVGVGLHAMLSAINSELWRKDEMKQSLGRKDLSDGF